MPNYCENLMRVEGTKEELEKFVSFVSTDEREFDFETILPYPKGWRELDNKVQKMRDDGVPAGERPQDGYNQGGYEWCLKNWGTKWNSMSPSVSSIGMPVSKGMSHYVEISFDTAWSPSLGVTNALSEKFPSLSFTHTFEESGCDFSGEYTFEEGECISQEDGEFGDYPVIDYEEFEDM